MPRGATPFTGSVPCVRPDTRQDIRRFNPAANAQQWQEPGGAALCFPFVLAVARRVAGKAKGRQQTCWRPPRAPVSSGCAGSAVVH